MRLHGVCEIDLIKAAKEQKNMSDLQKSNRIVSKDHKALSSRQIYRHLHWKAPAKSHFYVFHLTKLTPYCISAILSVHFFQQKNIVYINLDFSFYFYKKQKASKLIKQKNPKKIKKK